MISPPELVSEGIQPPPPPLDRAAASGSDQVAPPAKGPDPVGESTTLWANYKAHVAEAPAKSVTYLDRLGVSARPPRRAGTGGTGTQGPPPRGPPAKATPALANDPAADLAAQAVDNFGPRGAAGRSRGGPRAAAAADFRARRAFVSAAGEECVTFNGSAL